LRVAEPFHHLTPQSRVARLVGIDEKYFRPEL